MRGPSPEGTALPFAQPGTGEEGGREDSRLEGPQPGREAERGVQEFRPEVCMEGLWTHGV